MGSTSPTRGPASALFTPLSIANGTVTLKHRIIMSPMTRNRCVPSSQTNTPESPNRVWIPDELVAKYYGQRATEGGLIVTESILPNAEAGAMPGVPGLWLPEHLAGWKLVTQVVHSKGGAIYAQLTHQGRSALPQFTGVPTVSSSSKPWSTDEKYAYPPPFTISRVMYKDFPPIELTSSHIAQTIAGYVSAAKMAIEGGFDGIEIHGGNGYLVDQFLNSNVNIRTDSYGGDATGRCRFLLELVEGIGREIGEEKVAVRLTPWGVYNDMLDDNRWETWSYLCLELGKRFPRLSYVHFVEARQEELPLFEQSWGIGRPTDLKWAKEALGPSIPVISAGIWDEESVWGAVETGRVDGCVFARWFVSNPDLVERLRNGWKFSEYNRGKFYGPTSKRGVGYTDYKTWEELEAEKMKKS